MAETGPEGEVAEKGKPAPQMCSVKSFLNCFRRSEETCCHCSVYGANVVMGMRLL